MHQSNTIVAGDVTRVLNGYPDSIADLAIADSGYGLKKADWDQEPDYGHWIQEALRILKPTGTAYIFGLPETVALNWAAFPAPKRLLTWHVTNRVSPKCPTWQSTQESIVMLWKGKPWFDRNAVREPYSPDFLRHQGKPRASTPGRFGSRATRYSSASGALPRDVIKGPGLSGKVGARESLGHPAQKPLWLMERLIKASCPAGGLVLDLFAGTSTASLAAHRLGRDWISIEADPHWCEVSRARLQAAGANASIVTPLGPHALAELVSWRGHVERELAYLRVAVAKLTGKAGGSI